MKKNCPICKQVAGSYSIKIDTFTIYKCSNCGIEYTYPMPTNTELKKFYLKYNDIRAHSDIVELNAKENLKKLVELGLTKESKVLDFGCGNSSFIDIVGENCFGIDLKPSDHPRILRDMSKLPHKKFDMITLWGVLEHLNTIEETMKEISSIVKENGYIIITTVNAEGNIPYYYKPPEHLTYWTRNSLHKLAKKINCRIEETSEYHMFQHSNIYCDRLLSRTPKQYAKLFLSSLANTSEIIQVPTNELFAILKKEKL